MKKYIILICIAVIAICSIVYLRYQTMIKNNMINYKNIDYIGLKDKEISATELGTIINKTINKNVENNVEKDENGLFIDNGNNSIIIEVKFLLGEESTYRAELIEKRDIKNFLVAYTGVNFKCTKLEYHESTHLVKYLLFEEQ